MLSFNVSRAPLSSCVINLGRATQIKEVRKGIVKLWVRTGHVMAPTGVSAVERKVYVDGR